MAKSLSDKLLDDPSPFHPKMVFWMTVGATLVIGGIWVQLLLKDVSLLDKIAVGMMSGGGVGVLVAFWLRERRGHRRWISGRMLRRMGVEQHER
ncbi:MAG TPA: hypothetical protein VNA25_04085 [Phycisphaerae bacterium]|nr:hypothetical protein [Phycisphaerae bacterium]